MIRVLLFLIIAGATFLALPETYAQNAPAAMQSQHPPAAVESPASENAHLINERAIAAGTVVLAIVTAGLAVFTYRLWKATKELVESADTNSARQLRAYVLATTAVTFPMDGTNNIRVAWKNFGNTPASKCEYWIAVRAVKKGSEFPREKDSRLREQAVGTLAPGQKFSAKFDMGLLEHDQEVHAGQYDLAVFGEFRYLDVFKEERKSHFFFHISGPGWTETKLEIATIGNDAT